MQEQDWKALSRIAGSPEGGRLRKQLEARRESCRDSLEKCHDSLQLARLQGEAGTLARLIEELDQARDVVNQRYS